MPSDQGNGPPGPPQPQGDATTTSPATIKASGHFHARRQGGPEAWMWRRRQAAQRMVPLGQCGFVRDPAYDRHRCGRRPLSDHQVDSWRQTAQHILEGGHVPMVPVEALRAMWRRGCDDRALAQELYELAGGVVA